MTWKPKLTWTDNQTTHEGRTYHLWHHGAGADDRGRHGSAWFLHGDDGTGYPDQNQELGILGRRIVRARKLAELLLLGWQPAIGNREAGTGRERWRSPSGELHPLDEVLDGQHREDEATS